jgi:1-acyl-sn-glycerol-3-phosphate acyltransferase
MQSSAMQIAPVAPASYVRRNNRFTRTAGRFLLWLGGWRLEGTMPDVPKVVVTVAPHTSNWDFVVGVSALWALDIKIAFFGKHTLFRGPFAKFMYSIGGIPVDRSASHGIVGEIVQAFNRSEKLVFALSPEGTRQLDKGFKTGFLHIAHGANVPICLASFDFARKVIGFGPLMTTTGDVNADLKRVEDYYRRIPGKYVKDWQRNSA